MLPLWLMRLRIKLCISDARYKVQLIYTSIRIVADEVSISLHPFSNGIIGQHQIRLGAHLSASLPSNYHVRRSADNADQGFI